jgi:uncharacterized protein with HEPN domain
MQQAAKEAVEFTSHLAEAEYLNTLVVRRAVERSVEIVGEAARKISESGRAAMPQIAWPAIIATRHIIAHEYSEVDHTKLWRITTTHLPPLIGQIEQILADHPPPPESGESLLDP